MHMGALSISAKLNNLTHIVFNNKSHDSVGGQPTCAPDASLSQIAKSLGYVNVLTVLGSEDIETALRSGHDLIGSTFIEIMCDRGNRADLGRPVNSPKENFNSFQLSLKNGFFSCLFVSLQIESCKSKKNFSKVVVSIFFLLKMFSDFYY